jgi:hypothetical protein
MGAGVMIVFSITGVICLICVLATWNTASSANNNIIFGVTLPGEGLNSDEVKALKKEYKKQCIIYLIVLIAAFVPLFIPVSYISFPIIYFILWVTAGVIFVMGKPVVSANRKLAQIKKKNGWLVGIVHERKDKVTGEPILVDDDDYWKDGIWYNNPSDSNTEVEKRIGIGTTLNMATTFGKWFVYGLTAFVIVIVISVSAFILLSDIITPDLQISNSQSIKINAIGDSTSFKVSDIQDVTLMNELPKGYKINGAATSVYARGTFKLEGYGRTKVYIFTDKPPYIAIRLSDSCIFYNEKDKNETLNIYNKLKKLITH